MSLVKNIFLAQVKFSRSPLSVKFAEFRLEFSELIINIMKNIILFILNGVSEG